MEKGPQTHEMSQENAFFTQNQSFKSRTRSLLGINVLNVESRITTIFELFSRSLRAGVSYIFHVSRANLCSDHASRVTRNPVCHPEPR